jgi:hypothetical protein
MTQSLPIRVGFRDRGCRMQFSSTVDPSPTSIGPKSARSTAPGQTLVCDRSVTSPITSAAGWT